MLALFRRVTQAAKAFRIAPTSLALGFAPTLLALGLAAACGPHGARPAPALSRPTQPPQLAQPPPRFDAAAYEREAREAYASFRAGDHRAAAQRYERALAYNPGDDEVMYLIALSSLRAGDPAAALRWLARLADAGSDLVPTRDQFAELTSDATFQEHARRLAANAARYRRGVEAFRIPEKGLLPEGIAYDPAEAAFYVGSTRRRKIVKVTPGRPAVDFAGPRPEIDAIGGLRVDASRRRLWAVSGTDRRMDGFSANEPGRNALVELDLATGATVGLYRLEVVGKHGLNDVAVDARGRPFATDRPAGQLYTLTEDGRSLAPVFDEPPFFYPNGLAFDDTGTTLFVADSTGVYRVDVAARRATRLSQPPGANLAFFDGLYFTRSEGGARLVGVQTTAGPGRVVAADLNPALDAITRTQTLESDHPAFDAPTTGAVVGSWFYVIANSQLWAPREPAETIILKVPLSPPAD